ncbi:hypothetical protein [Kineococcus sp. NPDC059986]
MSRPPFDPDDPPVPELEVDEDVPPRPEEDAADAGRDETADAPHSG